MEHNQEAHVDDFAKIIRTKSGRQVLAYCGTSDENDNPQVVLITALDGVTVRLGMDFKDTDEGHDQRDEFFEHYNAESAGKFEAMAIKAIA